MILWRNSKTTGAGNRREPHSSALWPFAALLLALASAAAAPAPSHAQSDDALKPGRGGLDPWNVDLSRPETGAGQEPAPRVRPTAARHVEFIQAGVPVEYRSQRSPYANAPRVITEGGVLYRANCAGCHGQKGRGDGDAGLDLLPSPALLSELMDAQGSVDEYLLWSIAEGGAPFGTAMPAYKDRLSENDIWRIIAYMRAGFPPADG